MFNFGKSARVVPATRENSTADDQYVKSEKMFKSIKDNLSGWDVIVNQLYNDTTKFTITFTCSNGTQTFNSIMYDSSTKNFTYNSKVIANTIENLKAYIEPNKKASGSKKPTGNKVAPV